MPRIPKTRRSGVTLMADFSSVAKFVGAGEALIDSSKDKQYQTDIVKYAYRQAEEDFNADAAAMGAAGSIRHMFEWGTQGINTRRSNLRPNPLSEQARLWHSRMVGAGLNQKLMFVYKTSVAIVPKPTAGETGMSTEDIDSLEDHVFWNKAQVLEEGRSVTISPKNAKFLLIPYYQSQRGSLMFSEADIERGFTLSKGPHTHEPGEAAGTVGNFTEFWMGWWESQGNAKMNASVTAQIESDFYPDLKVNYSTTRPSMVVPGEFKKDAQREKNRIKRAAKAKARMRVGRKPRR